MNIKDELISMLEKGGSSTPESKWYRVPARAPYLPIVNKE